MLRGVDFHIIGISHRLRKKYTTIYLYYKFLKLYMSLYSKIQILWNGKLPIHRITWDTRNFKEQKLLQIHEKSKDRFWKNHLEKYPKDYDGTLLYLTQFQQFEKTFYT